jgi:tRNA nucleotidyltransferase (CCA-adding enzyme)
VDEAKLREKLSRIEALFAGATTEGERVAAAEARQRIQARLESAERAEPAVEYRFTLGNPWARKVFVALLRRYDLKPYRYRGQRRTTVMVKVPQRFVDETLWPEFQQIDAALQAYLDEVTDRIIAETIHRDSSEAAEVAEPPKLAARSIDVEK